MRVNVTIEVPDGGVRHAAALSRRLIEALHAERSRTADVPLAGDRIERSPAAKNANGLGALAALASSHSRGGGTYVLHGSLRVPRHDDGQFRRAVRYLERDSAMRGVIARVEHSHTQFTLRVVHDGNDRYEPDAHTVVWDPFSALRTTQGGGQSPALGLGHELAHAAASPYRYDRGCDLRLRGYDNGEERRVIRGAEAHAARALGEAQRFDHRGTLYRVDSPVVA